MRRRSLPKRLVGTTLASIALAGAVGMAQARPEDGGQEIELWSGGGHYLFWGQWTRVSIKLC